MSCEQVSGNLMYCDGRMGVGGILMGGVGGLDGK